MRIETTDDPSSTGLATIRVEDWVDADRELFRIDERVEATREGTLGLDAGAGPFVDAAHEVLTRYQWRIARRNGASATRLFDRVLARHLEMHDTTKPLVRADLVHSLDTWQWMLRLWPTASLAAQIAALFHDIERLASEADVRVEHRASDYRAFKRAHAREGARMLRGLLVALDAPLDVVARATALVEGHEEKGADIELALLNDADALSFFSRNSDGFLRYYGAEHTRAKVRFTLGRLGPAARARLRAIRLGTEVRRMVEEEPRSIDPVGPRNTE